MNINFKNKTTAITNFQESINLYSLFTRKYFTSWMTLYIYVIPLILILSWAMIFPMQYSTILVISISLGFSTFFVYGMYFFTFRKSVLYKMVQNSSFGRTDLYFSILFLILLSNLFVFLYIIGLYVLFAYIGLASAIFAEPIGESDILAQDIILTPTTNFSTTNWSLVIYYYFIYSFVSFALAFLLQNLTKSSLGFFLLATTYLVLIIFFGGVINSSCSTSVTGIFSWTDEAAGEGVFFLNPNQVYSYDPDSNYILLYPTFIERIYEFDNENIDYIWLPINADTDNFIWYVNQLIPVFGLNSTCFSMFTEQTFKDGITVYMYVDGQWVAIQSGATINLKYFSVMSGYYFWLLISPYFWIIFYILLGVFLSRDEKT